MSRDKDAKICTRPKHMVYLNPSIVATETIMKVPVFTVKITAVVTNVCHATKCSIMNGIRQATRPGTVWVPLQPF